MIDIFSVYMSSFEEDRLVRVYVPTNYQTSNVRYPVLYMHDGQNVFNDQDAIGGVSLGLEAYLDDHELDVIVVAIDQKSEERRNEYCPWVNGEFSRNLRWTNETFGGKGKAYIEFVVDELKPIIDKKYRTQKDRTAMAGISFGGLITTYAVCTYPSIFKNAAILSSAFYANQEEIENLIKTSDLSEIESFYMDGGTREAGEDLKLTEGFLASNEAVYEILKDKIPNAEYKLIQDAEHHYTFFKKRIPELLSFLK